uniref:Uncharacterized protein n=1 Tax=viral metagenome TaxID=1070528 RepID=A0A6M3K119_9ZZZZ
MKTENLKTDKNKEKLERYIAGCVQTMEKEFFDCGVDITYDRMREKIILTIKAYVLADNFKHYERKWPKDWWQAFKERWFPKWILHKWPVVYNELIVDVRALYPEYRPKIPKEKFCFHLSDIEDERI